MTVDEYQPHYVQRCNTNKKCTGEKDSVAFLLSKRRSRTVSIQAEAMGKRHWTIWMGGENYFQGNEINLYTKRFKYFLRFFVPWDSATIIQSVRWTAPTLFFCRLFISLLGSRNDISLWVKNCYWLTRVGVHHSRGMIQRNFFLWFFSKWNASLILYSRNRRADTGRWSRFIYPFVFTKKKNMSL